MEALQVLAMWAPSFAELMVIMAIALLLFGKRLPEVARSLGKGVVEFKKGIKGIEDDVENAEYKPPKKIYSGENYSGEKRPSQSGEEAPKS